MFWEVQNYASFPLTIVPVAEDDTINIIPQKEVYERERLALCPNSFLLQGPD